jgi:hypothetical protein
MFKNTEPAFVPRVTPPLPLNVISAWAVELAFEVLPENLYTWL